MEPASPVDPHPGPTLFQLLGQMGIFSVFFILVAIILAASLVVLFRRVRPLGEHLAYVAATFFPFVLGFLGGSLSLTHFFRVFASGSVGPGPPGEMMARCLGEMFLRLECGSALTCIFLPLGILALLVRRPK
jgi:hypothetical protein